MAEEPAAAVSRCMSPSWVNDTCEAVPQGRKIMARARARVTERDIYCFGPLSVESSVIYPPTSWWWWLDGVNCDGIIERTFSLVPR